MSTVKRVGGKKHRKTMKIGTFKNLSSRKIFNKGTRYYFEKVDSIGNLPKGDLVKKFVNGKLVKQKFVTEKKIKDLVKEFKKKSKMTGGDAGKQTVDNVQKVEIQDNSTMFQALKQSFAGGVGFFLGMEVVNGIVKGIFDN
jgi:ABC-type proline/glycine betaine transport system ATPase subunit